MASFQKVKGGWRAYVERRGVRATGTYDTKAKAQAWAGEVEAAILNGTYRAPNAPPTAESMTVAELFRRYSQKVSTTKDGAKWEQSRIEKFLADNEAIAATRLSECTSQQFADWRDARLEHVSSATVIREMNLYSNIFCVARDESKLIEKSPLSGVRRPKEPKPRDRRISDDESEKLLFALGYGGNDFATISARVGAMFLFAIETGARASEMVRLTWDRVTLSRQYVHFPKTKNGFARDVALSPRAIKIIQSFAPLRDKENKADPVFKVNTSQLDALFRKARDKCKIKDLHFHDTRHEAITRLAKKLAVLDLARMVGIRDLDILMVYYNETAEDMAKKLAN
ncbi:site-specific integrase [Paraburkholderia panacisoli]|uniref:Site-specific integrase n=1 Tax=Paraburkholderia panacisoli TaxID=2603818 RepID=A0A5B0HLJ7_9BURK|nr:site-specific integrase [Paraburkholderia panacisoli]